MSKLRDFVIACIDCRAKTEVYTDWRTGRLMEIPGVCTCTKTPDLSSSYAALRTCQTPGCVRSCRFRFCLECSNERQADTDRNRHGPLPKCACGVQLSHRQSIHCPACKRRNNTEWQRAHRDDPPKPRLDNSVRDTEILRRLAAGEHPRAIAVDYDITAKRVRQIKDRAA